MRLKAVSKEFYPMALPHDEVYQLVNENEVPIGVVFLSLYDEYIYIEWLEILTNFRGMGYLRKFFRKLAVLFQGQEIQFQCGDELLRKYTGVGCVKKGEDACTELNIMVYGGSDGER